MRSSTAVDQPAPSILEGIDHFFEIGKIGSFSMMSGVVSGRQTRAFPLELFRGHGCGLLKSFRFSSDWILFRVFVSFNAEAHQRLAGVERKRNTGRTSAGEARVLTPEGCHNAFGSPNGEGCDLPGSGRPSDIEFRLVFRCAQNHRLNRCDLLGSRDEAFKHG